MKAIIINIHNKLQIPTEKLDGKEYTFSVSNVSNEMGLNQSTTFYKFEVLKNLHALKKAGTKITSHGEVILYSANKTVIDKIVSGDIIIPKGSVTKIQKSRVGSSCNEVGLSSNEVRTSSDEEGSSCNEVRTSSDEEGSSCNEVRTSCNDSTIQIVHPNGSQQMDNNQMVAAPVEKWESPVLDMKWADDMFKTIQQNKVDAFKKSDRSMISLGTAYGSNGVERRSEQN